MTSLKVSLYAGFLLALPIFLWQFWSFVAPAFDRGAQRAVRVLVLFSGVLLAAGVGFAYKVVLPASVHFLTTFDAELYDVQVRASSYFSFALLVVLSVGIVFQLPIFVLGLVRLGVTSATRLRRNRRIGYVIVTAVAVVLPGVDPITTLLTRAASGALRDLDLARGARGEAATDRSGRARVVVARWSRMEPL